MMSRGLSSTPTSPCQDAHPKTATATGVGPVKTASWAGKTLAANCASETALVVTSTVDGLASLVTVEANVRTPAFSSALNETSEDNGACLDGINKVGVWCCPRTPLHRGRPLPPQSWSHLPINPLNRDSTI